MPKTLTFLAAALVAPGAMAHAQAAAEPAPPTPQAIAEGVWMIPGGFMPKRQPDGATIVFEGPSGLIVMDTGRHRWHRRAILDLAQSRGKPITAIVNSHWHLDHVSGNADLKAVYPRARVYATGAIEGALKGFLPRSAEGARQAVQEGKLPPETVEDIKGDLATFHNAAGLRPDVTVGRDRALSAGGRTVELHFVADGPTEGDLWVYDPKTRIAAVGDLVTLPVPFLDTACVAGWRKGLADVAATDFDKVVPGHGPVMTREDFTAYRQAFDAFVDCAASTREKAECARDWTSATGRLIGDEAAQKRAQGMAQYYVEDVLRANGGNSATCRKGNRG